MERRHKAPLDSSGRPPVRRSIAHPAWTHTSATTINQPADDDQATARTIETMRHLTLADVTSQAVQAAADIATADTLNVAEAAAGIFEWIRRRVLFTEDKETARLAGLADPESAEVLIRPADLLAMREPAGDCDDFAMLTASMLMAAGIPAKFRTIAADPSTTNWSHVYTVAMLPAGELAMDTSHGPAPAWEAPAQRTKDWNIMPTPSNLAAVSPWVQDLLKIGAETGATIAKTRYGQAPAGVYTQGADGSIYYRAPEGAGPLAFPGVNVNTGATTWILLAAGILVLVLVMKGNR